MVCLLLTQGTSEGRMGRKTETYNVDTRSETNYRFEQQQKNLGPQLGGVIFSEHCCCLLAGFGCCCLSAGWRGA